MTEYPGQAFFTHSHSRIYSVPPGRSFLDDLAKTIHNLADNDPLAIANISIYLPTRRAMRTLGQRLIDTSPHKVSLLPSIRAIGSMDDDLLTHHDSNGFDTLTLAPALSSLERRLILARLAARQNAMFAGQENWMAALGAAMELEKLLDSFYTEEIDPLKLDELAPDKIELAEHWQVSRDFLSIITKAWPAILAERGVMDPAARRIALIRRAAEQWKKNPPQTPIILAGTTGSTPAVADLMQIVRQLPQGCVILPGVDHDLDEAGWEAVDDAHPQSGLKALLKRLKISRDDIALLPVAQKSTQDARALSSRQARQDLLSLALRPAEKTDDWLKQIETITPEKFSQATQGLSLVAGRDDENEADIIALTIRQTLDLPDKTVMLVTPDRDLARRVSTKLRRWHIATDDSGGVPLGNTPTGTFLRLVAIWVSAPSNPLALMSVLRHPLCRPDTGENTPFSVLSILDRSVRGLQPRGSFTALCQMAKSNAKAQAPQLERLLTWLAQALEVLPDVAPPQLTGFGAQLHTHLNAAIHLTTDNNGQCTLWAREDGRAASDHLDQLQDYADYLNDAPAHDYPGLFSQLIAGVAVRPLHKGHPRVAILGPLEARLHHADHMILGGLNEGVWPGDAVTDGFLSRQMRAKINLPSPERRIGLSAHDFAQLACLPRVTLTRSLRTGNAPATPSRWLVRLQNIFTAFEKSRPLQQPGVDQSTRWQYLATSLDHARTVTPIKQPRPTPPAAARPRSLFVTRIEKWLRDPYSIYAHSILKLRPLDQFNEEFGPRHVGIAIHDAFEHYTKATDINPDGDLDRLRTIFAAELAKLNLPPRAQSLWSPAFDKSLTWFVVWHASRLTEGKPVVLEQTGSWTFTVGEGEFTLKARADRIDLVTNHFEFGTGLTVYDYKTGTLKSQKQDKAFSPQLALTSLIACHGGFDKVNASNIIRQAYIKTFGRKSDDDWDRRDTNLLEGVPLQEAIEGAETGLRALIATFDDETVPYLSQPRPEYMSDFGDYDHLARRREWAAEQGDSGADATGISGGDYE